MKYQDAFSYELGKSISAHETVQMLLEGKLNDTGAFKCRAAKCGAELTLINAGTLRATLTHAHSAQMHQFAGHE